MVKLSLYTPNYHHHNNKKADLSHNLRYRQPGGLNGNHHLREVIDSLFYALVPELCALRSLGVCLFGNIPLPIVYLINVIDV